MFCRISPSRSYARSGNPALIETLESRTLLSAVPAAVHAAHAKHAAAHAVHKPVHHKAPRVIADPIYMSIPGITGEVTTKGFAGDIELHSFQWGVGRGISSPTGGSSDRESSTPSVSEITITKNMDKTSPKLLDAILSGKDEQEVDIYFVNITRGDGGLGTQVYAEYKLSDVLVSGYSVSSGGDRPTESLSLNFTKVEYSYFAQNADGTTTPIVTNYDLTTAQSYDLTTAQST